MTSLARTMLVFGCLLAAGAVHAQDSGNWGSSRFVRIGADRVVVFSHGSTFDLQRDASWDIADADQKKRFQTWVKANGLPTDPNQFVADLPPSKRTPLSAEILVGAPSDAGATLSLKFGDGAGVKVAVLHATRWTLAPTDRPVVEEFASKLKTTIPTLLVSLSDSTKPTEPVAWERVVERSGKSGGFVTLLNGGKSSVWTHRGEGLAAPTAPIKPSAATDKAVAPGPGGSVNWLYPAVGGGVVLVGAVLFATPGVRTRVLGSVRKSGSEGPAAFPLGSHERELILKVRDEGKRRPPPPNSLHSEEEYAVGMMLDRYNGYETLSRELENARKQAEALQAFRNYQERYEEYEQRYSTAKDELAKKETELAKQQTARKDLQEKLRQADTYLKDLQAQQAELLSALQDAEKLLTETGEWSKSVTERLNSQAAKIHNE